MSKDHLEVFITQEREGTYFTIPFEMPENTASCQISYRYARGSDQPTSINYGSFAPKEPVNTIDLGLLAPDGSQVGVSGSDKSVISIGETRATPGYKPHALTPGTWQILVGAYHVAVEGVQVDYELEFTSKKLELYLGDLHTHTVGSDGVLTKAELALHAKAHNLDFLAITDHNQMATREGMPDVEGICLIPGVEWTHFKGHATFLGIDQPYDDPFFTNDFEGVQARFSSARDRGALISIAHPFEEICPFTFDMSQLPFDCYEVWNGPIRESNLRAISAWMGMLAGGRKLPLIAGSDYHRDNIFQILGGPSLGVYSLSNSPSDLLQAIKAGHSFVTYAPTGPKLHLTVGNAIMGGSCPVSAGNPLHIHATGLTKGDIIQLLTIEGRKDLVNVTATGECELDLPIDKPGFAVVQILRQFLPGLPPLPALLSNPIYFE